MHISCLTEKKFAEPPHAESFGLSHLRQSLGFLEGALEVDSEHEVLGGVFTFAVLSIEDVTGSVSLDVD